MEHSFDVDVAAKYGIAVAILLKHFDFWCEKNKENNKHYHDGRYWTYHSVKSLMELFPYFTRYQIRQALEDMVKEDLIIEGNYSNKMNRSKWYALSENGKCIIRNQQMHCTDSANAFVENGQCIVRNQTMHLSNSNNHTDIYTDIYTDTTTTDTYTDGGGTPPLPSKKKPKPVKHRYGEYDNVLLTDDELAKLRDICDADEMIERLSGYIASTGKKYKSHYATIRNWVRRDLEQNRSDSMSKVRGHDELNAFYNMAAEWADEG